MTTKLVDVASRYRRPAMRWLASHWQAVAVGLAPLLLVWMLGLVTPPVFVVTSLLGLGLGLAVGMHRPPPGPPPVYWHSPFQLAQALTDAGIVPRLPGGQLPWLSYWVTSDELGTTVHLSLPGRTFRYVESRKDTLASVLRVRDEELAVSRGDRADQVRIRVGRVAPAPSSAPSPLSAAIRTDWLQPVRIGVNDQGGVVSYSTFEHNGLVAGRPGSGKTSLARIVLAHTLLDPDATAWVLDGKGSRDYVAARSLCERFVLGTDETAVPATIELLELVLAMVRARNAEGGKHAAGALVLLEELQDVRAAATRRELERLDTLLGRVVRMGRAASVHVLVSTQRPTVDDLPAGTRNLLSQRIALQLRNAADTALVLGSTPELALPTRRGQALYTDGGPVAAVTTDWLTTEAWERVCARATELRRPATAERPATTTPGDSRFLPAALRQLEGGVLTASQLHQRLPQFHAEYRDAQAVGRALGKLVPTGLVARARGGPSGKDPAWTITEAGRASLR